MIASAAQFFPNRFNQRIRELGNKAELLSYETLNIVNELRHSKLLETIDPAEEFYVACDKHGGRSKYVGMINQYLTPEFVRIHSETTALSSYSWKESERQFKIDFQSKGETFLPAALSSMIAKYVRELAMHVWNEFWQLKKPGIAPTKGYPLDARRFKREIQTEQAALGIPDEMIWRNK